MGLDGEYYLLKFGGWALNSTHYFGDYYKSTDIEQTIQWVMMKDDKIEAYTFNNQKNGLTLHLEPIDRKEKERIFLNYKRVEKDRAYGIKE